MLDDCSASVLAVHPNFAEVAGPLTGPRRVDLDATYEDLLEAQPADLFEPEPFEEDDVCELFYTSGSTGSPKGAMLTHRALATHALDSALTLAFHHRDTQLHTIALFHVNGWGTPHYVTALGRRHVLLERFDAGEVLRQIEAESIRSLACRSCRRWARRC